MRKRVSKEKQRKIPKAEAFLENEMKWNVSKIYFNKSQFHRENYSYTCKWKFAGNLRYSRYAESYNWNYTKYISLIHLEMIKTSAKLRSLYAFCFTRIRKSAIFKREDFLLKISPGKNESEQLTANDATM